MIPNKPIVSYSKIKDKIQSEERCDFVSPEFPLEIAIKLKDSTNPPKNIAITMRSVGMDEELAYGFLFTEGIIESTSQILDFSRDEHKVVLTLEKHFDILLNKINRNFYTSSSCGICSKSDLSSIYPHSHYLPFTSQLKIPAKSLFNLKTYFEEEASIFSKTGGVHSCILLNSQLEKVGFFEDVGRHNALDKLIGWSMKEGKLPLSESIVLLSGRISFELVQKASMAGIPILCALGAPSSMAIDEAYAQSMCLIGFAKSETYNVYCGNERIIDNGG